MRTPFRLHASGPLGALGCAVFLAACGFSGAGLLDATGAVADAGAGEGSTRDGSGSDAPPADASDEALLVGDGATCVADLAIDPSNCGRCAHSCAGAACVAGKCQAVTLATRSHPYDLAVDATDVYWTDKGTLSVGPGVARCPKAGGTVVPVASASVGTADPASVTVQSGRVVFTDVIFNTVVSCGLPGPGCTDSQTTTESGPKGITTNGTKLFWVNGNSGNVRSDDVTLSNPQTIVQNQIGLSRVAANATTVFFTVTNGVSSGPVGGTTSPNAFSTGMNPRDLALDATYVYVAYATEVHRQTHAFGGEIVVAKGTDIQRLAVDASGIYFTDRGGAIGRILRCPVAGCTAAQVPEVLATGEIMPLGIALDATHVYWTNEATSGGTIRRVAK